MMNDFLDLIGNTNKLIHESWNVKESAFEPQIISFSKWNSY